MNSFLEFEYLEGEGGSDLVLRLWVGQTKIFQTKVSSKSKDFPS